MMQDLKHMSGKETMSKEELEALKKQWLEEMKANMKVKMGPVRLWEQLRSR
jgi:hypothetical protein